ncbi:hypothetical protein [Leisingera sp. M658]|uniref:hypothetical protein n=1 Tax=Leisingera sp. M658 TaxID=2867015 RepID=UPI0021A3AA58|nr:hypothetical protein [Leisingera sp. M658]UWQ74402.1 hypothetical protein K3724_18260 [Leisingera sp. M658]
MPELSAELRWELRELLDQELKRSHKITELTAEGREEIRTFLNQERRNLFIVGSASTIAVVTLIGGFLAYVLDDIRDRSAIAAEQAVASIRTTAFDPEIRKLDDAVSEARDQLSKEQRNLQTLTALVADAQSDIERLAAQARTALEELDKAEGSLVFAEKMLEFNSKISHLERKLSDFSGGTALSAELPVSPSTVPAWPTDAPLSELFGATPISEGEPDE